MRVDTLRVVKPGESIPQFVKRQNPVVQFRCVHPLGRKPVVPAQAIPKDSLLTKDWSEEYKSDNMFQEIYEHLTSKSTFQDGIYSEYFLDNGKLLMNGKLCVPDRLASRVFKWWHKWETPHSHGAKLWKSIRHRLLGAQLHTHCMKVASSCAQCAVAVPATAKPKGYLRPHPVPERLFDRVTSDFFHLGDLEGEECHWTNKKINGVLLIQCRHSGYIHVLPCNLNAMTGKAAAKWCAQTWMGCWDVPSEILTDSGSAYISEWWKTLCARLGIHHPRCEVHRQRALPAERAGKTRN